MGVLDGAGDGRGRDGTARAGTRSAEPTPETARRPAPAPAAGPGPGAAGERDDDSPAWEVVVRGDEDDFEAFARARMGDLLRYATALTGDPHQGADIVQEVLVRASSRWRRIRASDRPDLYVKRMVTNEHLSWRRRWYTRAVTATGDGMLHARAPIADDPAEAVVDRHDVQRRLAGLGARQRTVLVLRYLEGMDDHEVSQVLGVAPSTVRSTAARALANLRAADLPEEDR